VLLGLRHIPQLAQVGGDKPQAMPVNPAGYVEFTVIDHGPGLSSEDCAVATQRFWRKQHQAHGSGLGLAIVQRIAQCSDGELELLPWPSGSSIRAMHSSRCTAAWRQKR
jgi:signal transduction histidine kinase